ncbi:MAG: heavy-metal-associated domain-containing protein [Clostridia bacterium]|nr:heavy-metal-associated domain-containing protein [Clostridia bacterium]
MIKITLQVAGMTCGMCETHMNDVIRAAFPVKKVTSSRSKGETVILSEKPLDIEAIRRVVNATGYTMLSADEEVQQKRSLLSVFMRRKE